MGLFALGSVLKRIRNASGETLSAAMAGVKLGDTVLFAGTDDVRLATELATRAGLTGRVVALARDAAAAQARAERIEAGGGLVEPAHAPLNMLPYDSGSFDVAVAEQTLLALPEGDRRGALAEIFRVLRPGGRLLWIERQPRGGLFGLAPDSRGVPDAAARQQMLLVAGFRGVRTLAAAEGKIYLEGIKASH